MADINYSDLIPNNVDLDSDRRLKRALEAWHPKFMHWWKTYGPDQYQDKEVYLRTATSVDKDGWAQFGHVKMPDYRWGIFLAENNAENKTINFGDHKGQPVWQDVPGEYRGPLRRLIVTQGDTEPASVEQQRILAATAPSLYDMRNLFQVNVEEARHLWAMVYLLMAHFGRDGREEAEELLERRSGDPDKPRILGAFNERTPDWLSFYMFTYFTDRDGKYQLASLAESAFDPLARTCQFMLTEEAHHMYVGETGVARVIQRACDIMREHKTDDVRKFGGIDLPTIQKYVNFHFSVSEDLFGAEQSTNAANYFTQGLKGRYMESHIKDDHQLKDDPYTVTECVDGAIRETEVAALTAINERLRDDYITDCQRGVDRWNRVIREAGIDFEITLPHRAFHRQIGQFSAVKVSPEGRLLDAATWAAREHEWLPGETDHEYVRSLMHQVTAPGEFAPWIAPPRIGINNQPREFPYVKL
ncbi:MAG: benzoyl-CoA 2,3-epoxidase subunit BoxB [Gammaproteobacteria bacterium]|nr:benzoyl-CoA 2,3-epoxidase subunit BoxB [Gammaproteobacteria bacterium]MCP5199479.1 benzoyl-CoA 2,3-epoxidase subunit BoxB [Gammaproteobacteria bacterium]